ncbi:MAG: hypothetical protein IJ558_12520 [Treponema sp.]|nr:hypothetical protein [Treponema sp.]
METNEHVPRFPKIGFLVFCLLALSVCVLPLFAEEFSQKIEWKSNANALEYKIEIQNTTSGSSSFITTDKTSAELSLAPGSYRYRVTAYDFLGREAGVSDWTRFEVIKASTPKIGTVAENVKIDKNTNSIDIAVDISDVNANSTFELVNDTMQGTVDAKDRPRLNGTSETGSVSHLLFTDVPPGKWRLRVTNASGLSTLSDVITVEGEKMYTEEELAAIKAEAEEAVRKDMQENLDKYIAESEAAKAEAEKRHAEEEARMKAEREATERMLAAEKSKNERERIEAERAAKEEAKRIERERKEARKQAQAARKAANPYKWKDVIFEAGAGFAYNLYDGTLSDYYDTKYALALNARLAILPFKTARNKFGIEVSGTRQTVSVEKDLFYTAELVSTLVDVKFLWHHKLSERTYLAFKGGAGVDAFQTAVTYNSAVYESRSSADGLFLYPAVTGGASLFFTPWKFIVFEAGVDFTHVLADGMNTGYLTPYACLGFRF